MKSSLPNTQRNVEIKFRCGSLAKLRRRAVKLGARPVGILLQTDTYFFATTGRLKLREIKSPSRGPSRGPAAGQREAMLISYHRPDHPGRRQSAYRLVPVPDPASLKAALSDALGVRAIIRKRRELLMYKNVRIHLDRVHGLGDFGELEAVIGTSRGTGLKASRARIDELIRMLGIRKSDLLGTSYGEMKNARRQNK